MKQRWRSYGLWIALAALVGMVLQDFGVMVPPERYDAYVDILLTIAVLGGIINKSSGFRSEGK
ncbi:holin [Domibacillus mangrovi]|uniref:Holin n=1 Tax=Domibacillus mangrovi TaxID=1714354 RepID=A0A1Q5P6C3_9BACI|nr:holin [Domibacillus mangrovi]OKL37743.1 holin [Domibacillus mangrovi]